jgi:hypothetical protein
VQLAAGPATSVHRVLPPTARFSAPVVVAGPPQPHMRSQHHKTSIQSVRVRTHSATCRLWRLLHMLSDKLPEWANLAMAWCIEGQALCIRLTTVSRQGCKLSTHTQAMTKLSTSKQTLLHTRRLAARAAHRAGCATHTRCGQHRTHIVPSTGDIRNKQAGATTDTPPATKGRKICTSCQVVVT